ncbi:MAG: DUF2877 domain-containing protein [Rhodospirillales bacterium]|nr:DUF2877 domain-containing protein [Rhodospirillales bacterium]
MRGNGSGMLGPHAAVDPPGVLRIVLMGRVARRALSGPSSGRVLAVFRRSVYVETAAGLACLGATSLGAGPLNAVGEAGEELDEPLARLAADAPVQIVDESLTINNGLSLSWRGAAEWRPARGPWPIAILRESLAALRDLAAARAPADGIAPVAFRNEGPGPLREAAAAFGEWLREVIADETLRDPSGDIEALIGLGPGLTPAGDDYLGGALIALRAFGRPAIADRLAVWALVAARRRTSTISRAHLAAAAAGEGSEALHILLEALAKHRTGGLAAGLDRIDLIGHTSGWDALAGAVAACGLLVDAGRT